MDRKLGLGETFVNGRIINLDTAELSDIERYLAELDKAKESARNKLDKLVVEIKNI